jgi:hypothetical protein
MYIMKSIYLTPVACAALLFGCAIANAQTSNPPSDQPSTVSPNDDATHRPMREASARPDFDALDTKKRGKLTEDDVKGNKWLGENFARCDLDHDGTLSREEYAACKE